MLIGREPGSQKLPSIENIRLDIDKECNSAYHLAESVNPYSGRDLYTSSSALFNCRISPDGRGSVNLTIESIEFQSK
jgi:hypothetical protein